MVQLLAAIALLYLGRDIFIPVCMAFVLATLLRPVIRRLESWRIPTPLGAGMVIVAGLLMLWGAGYALTPAFENFKEQLPTIAAEAGNKVRTLPRPLNRLATILPSLDSTALQSVGDTSAAPVDSTRPRPAKHPSTPKPANSASNNSSSGPSSGLLGVAGKVFGTATDVFSTMVEILLLLLFFLAAGGEVRDRLMKSRNALAHQIAAVGDQVESIISRYLSLLSLINLAQGVIITVAMTLIHMKVPPVWGALAFVAEFFPYLGGATMVFLLTIVGLATQNDGSVLLAPAIYLAVTTIQNSVISPVTYGRYLKLSPAAILISVMTWWLIWGVMGAFLAVPILATLRVVCDKEKGRLGALGALIEG